MAGTRSTHWTPPQYAAMAAACLAAALAAAGCGSGSGGKGSQAKPNGLAQAPPNVSAVKTPQGDQIAASAQTPAGQPAQATSAGGTNAPVAGVNTPAVPAPQTYAVRPLAQIESRAVARLREFKAEQTQHTRLAAAEQVRAQLGAIRDLTDAVLVANGLDYATFDLMDGGATVTVNVDRKQACQLQESDAQRIEDQIVNASDVVLRVKLRVQGTPLTLGRYLKRNCASTGAQKTADKIVYTSKGSGITESPVFLVHGRNWKIDWTSTSALLQIYVYRNGKLQTIAVNHQGRGAAVRKLTGSGHYKLRIAGTGDWTVSVLDYSGPR